MSDFQFSSLPDPLIEALAKQNILEPTPIQKAAIPMALEGKDILGSAQTGTGKTAAFALPAIVKIVDNPKEHVLVLAPTREIATQISKAFQSFLTSYPTIRTALIIGGEPMGKQLSQLKKNPSIVIGTPGRVADHLRRKSLSLQKTTYLVLDETDRMLDMGFGIQIDEILEHMQTVKQTLLFSATLPKEIERIAQRYLHNPERIEAGSVNTAAPLVKQDTHNVKEADKFDKLCEVINESITDTSIIFVKTQFGAEKLTARLAQDGYLVDMLHGGLRQSKRDRVTKAFRNSKFNILVATDIAARGLDIPHLKTVINFDLPQCPEDYIHRIGRTGRAGVEGRAVSFVTRSDAGKWRRIEQLLDPNAKFKDAPKRDRESFGDKKGGFKKRKLGHSFDRKRSSGVTTTSRSSSNTRRNAAGAGSKTRSSGGFDKPRGSSSGRGALRRAVASKKY